MPASVNFAQVNRDVLVAAILEFLADQDAAMLADIRTHLEREIDAAGPRALLALGKRLTSDIGWGYYPRDPLAQRIHHLLADRFLRLDSEVHGIDNLSALSSAPVAILANHLSYADANIVEVLLHRAGAPSLAERLTAIAGPKIFSSRTRRFSSLCFGTVKAPQSADVSSEEAKLTAREVAVAARRAIDVAHERLSAGDALLLFGEGTRSRTGGMQPMLAAAARYLDVPDTWVLPVGLTGSERLFPVGGVGIQPARVVMQIGRPLRAAALMNAAGENKRLVMDSIGLAIARLLPPPYRGAYDGSTGYPEAENVLRACERAD